MKPLADQWEFSPIKYHELKCWPAYFSEVQRGAKRFELRLNDQDFEVGDFIMLKEWHLGHYTGRICTVRISYILDLKNYKDVKGCTWRICRKLMPNLVIMSVNLQESGDSPT